MVHPPDTNVRWLDDAEKEAWHGLARTFTLLPSVLDSQLRRDAELSHFEYVILVVLSEAGDRTCNMTHIAEFAACSPSRLSHAVRRLESQGWVSRATDPDNRRVTLATLTDSGLAKLEDAAPGHVELVREIVFDSLSLTQVKQLQAITQKITTAIRAKQRQGAS